MESTRQQRVVEEINYLNEYNDDVVVETPRIERETTAVVVDFSRTAAHRRAAAATAVINNDPPEYVRFVVRRRRKNIKRRRSAADERFKMRIALVNREIKQENDKQEENKRCRMTDERFMEFIDSINYV